MATNISGKIQIMYHDKYGTMARGRSKLKFVSVEDGYEKGRTPKTIMYLRQKDVPANEITIPKIKPKKKKLATICEECNRQFPRKELDNGVCRSCLCGYDSEEEHAALDVFNQTAMGGNSRGYEIHCQR